MDRGFAKTGYDHNIGFKPLRDFFYITGLLDTDLKNKKGRVVIFQNNESKSLNKNRKPRLYAFPSVFHPKNSKRHTNIAIVTLWSTPNEKFFLKNRANSIFR